MLELFLREKEEGSGFRKMYLLGDNGAVMRKKMKHRYLSINNNKL